MTPLFYFFAGLATASIIVSLWELHKKAKENNTSTKEELLGICQVAIESRSQKKENKKLLNS